MTPLLRILVLAVVSIIGAEHILKRIFHSHPQHHRFQQRNMGLLDDIKCNLVEELHMCNDSDDYFESPGQFEDAMKENTSITKVTFDGDFLVCLKAEDRAIIVSCLGRLPNLETVVLKDSRLLIGICVTNLVKNSPKLSSLSMVNCTLQGVPEDFVMFKTALGEKSCMKTLRIEDSFAPNEDVKLDSVLEGLKDLSIEISG